jgi:hypothetical protein
MRNDDKDQQGHRIPGLTRFQSGIVFVLIATLIFVYVGYQIHTGRVFTKSGEMPLEPGLAWAWLTLESVAAMVGLVRGVYMIRQ